MKVTFAPSFKEHYLATLTLQVLSPFLFIIILIFPLAGIFILVMNISFLHRIPPFNDMAIILLALGFPFYLNVLTIFLIRRKNMMMRSSHTYEFSVTGIDITGSGFKMHLDWQTLKKIRETNRFFFLYISPRIAYFIPKSSISSSTDLNTLRQIFIEHAGMKTQCLNN